MKCQNFIEQFDQVQFYIMNKEIFGLTYRNYLVKFDEEGFLWTLLIKLDIREVIYVFPEAKKKQLLLVSRDWNEVSDLHCYDVQTNQIKQVFS